jgi:hypothetical protein
VTSLAKTLTRFPRVLLASAVFLAGVFSLSGTALAQARPRPLNPFYVVPIGQVLLPDEAPLDTSERTFGDGDLVLTGRIGYRTFALVTEPVQFSIADQRISLTSRDMLAESRVTGGDIARLGQTIRVFCLAPRLPSEPEGAPRIFLGGSARFRDEIQPCFIDRDRDGRLDHALLAGTRRALERMVVAMPSTPYSVRNDVPIPGAQIRITFSPDLALTPPSLVRGILLPGAEYMGFDSIKALGPDGRLRTIPSFDGVTSRVYPHVIRFGPARIEILGYDRETERVRLRVLEGFTRTDLELVLLTYGR